MRVTTANPGLCLLLVDGSHSTGATWANHDGSTVAQTIHTAVNRTIVDLAREVIIDGDEVRERLKLGAFLVAGDSPKWALACDEPDEGWINANGPEGWVLLGEQVGENEFPQWIEFSPKGKTPFLPSVKKALECAERFSNKCIGKDGAVGSVLMMTITDGDFDEIIGDNPTEIESLAIQISNFESQGWFTHIVIHISADGAEPEVHPISPPNDKFGRLLYDLSTSIPIKDGGKDMRRAYVRNADPGLISSFLELGSKFLGGTRTEDEEE